MITLRPEDTIHKSHLNRILIEVIDNTSLSRSLALKGDTCASMLGYSDRFSFDLDFDLVDKTEKLSLRREFKQIFSKLGLTVVREFDKVLFFQLKYPVTDTQKRSTIKVSVSDVFIKSNEYKAQYFSEIDRFMKSQTIETMFANKLVAITDRYQKHKTIAGRDIYDVHHFFLQGYSYHAAVIEERTSLKPEDYLIKLADFIKMNVTQTIINEDLNSLLPNAQFQKVRKIIIPETLHFLTSEQTSLSRLK